MVGIDIIGLVFTWLAVGIRYPFIVFCATLVNLIATTAAVLFCNGQILSVLAAGAFGAVTSDISGFNKIPILLSGPCFCYLLSVISGGVCFESTACLMNPIAKLKHPFAVVNSRFALLSFIINIWQYIL